MQQSSSTNVLPATVKKPSGQPEEVYVIIRFDSKLAQNYRNSIKLQQSMMNRTYHGTERLFCSEMVCVSGNTNLKRGIGVIEFDCIVKAHEWMSSSPQVRQQDWLHGVDIIIVPARTAWHPELAAVEIIDWCHLHDAQGFQEDYLDHIPFPDPTSCGPYNIIAVPDYAMQRIRGCWEPRYLVLHQWKTLDDAQAKSVVQEGRHALLTDVAAGATFMGVSDVI